MTIKINKSLVSTSKNSIKCPYSMTATSITVHNTYNDAPASNEIRYMNSNNNQVSFHYAVDDNEVILAVPENRNAWHSGDGSGVNSGNRTSIGIEICYSKSGGTKYKNAEKLAIKFIAQILKERGWGIDRVKKHQDWSGKYCPHRILDEGRWNSFKNEIKAELDILNGGKITTVSKPKEPVTAKKDEYYTSNPGTIKVIKECWQYNSTDFADKNKVQKVKADSTKYTVDKIVKTKAGTPRLLMKNGTYMTANKKYVKKA